MGEFSIFHWLIVLLILGVPILLIALIVGVLKPQQNEIANTWKFRTFIHIGLAFLFSFLLITIPLFLYFAYRSYTAGSTFSSVTASSNPPSISSTSKAEQIERLHNLLSSGALTQAEYEIEKSKVLNS